MAIHAQAGKYARNLLSAVTESGLDIRAMPAIFLGGGAALLKRHLSATDGLCRPLNSPSMAEDKLHTAILTVLNRVVEASDGLQDELAETLRMVCTPEGDGNNLMELERNMEALTTRQNTLLDQVLAHMDDLTLTEQLKALLEEKQHLQTRIDAAKKEAANRINEDSRMAEYTAYLEEHLNGFPHYDDEIVRKMIERVTVVDSEIIRVKFRYSDLEIEQSVC